MTVSVAYNMTDVAKVLIIRELRKFFMNPPVAPYSVLLPNGFFAAGINDDMVSVYDIAGKYKSGMAIVDQQSYDDEVLPCVIVRGIAGPMKPSGFRQAAQKSIDTIETIPTSIVPVVASSPEPGVLATDFQQGSVIDTVTLTAGDRILLMIQANPAENGVYVVQALGAPVRSADFNTPAQFVQYTTVITVLHGAILGGRQFAQISPQPTTLGTDPINYEEYEFDERVDMSEPTIKFEVVTRSTSQRDRVVDTLMFAISNQKLVWGQLAAQDIVIQNNSPGFIRNNGYSEEQVGSQPGYQMRYKAELSSNLWLQWNYRTLIDAAIAAQIVAKDQLHTTLPQ